MNSQAHAEKYIAVVVDAYGPGRWFSTCFDKSGIICVHIQSTLQPLPALTPVDLPAFYSNIVHHGDLAQTAAQITLLAGQLQAKVLCIIPGVEPGVLLADELSEMLGLVTNGTDKSAARRDKFLMAKALQAAKIKIPKYIKSADIEEIVTFVETNVSWPRVIKPLDSAGCNGVFICDDASEVRRAFAENIGQTNNMGRVNQEVLVQSFLDGQEYMVNTVSLDGKHYVSDIWHAKKIRLTGRAFIYDRNELLAGSDPITVQLGDYVKTVLDALDIRNGPAHAEVIMTADGPVLVEVAARISGLVDPVYNDLLLGHNQIALTVEAYTEPECFAQRLSEPPYQLKKHGMQVCLISTITGTVKALPFRNALGDLSSLVGLGLKLKEGGPVMSTIDLSSCPGVCNLAHVEKAVMEQDFAAIRLRFSEGVELV